MLLRGIATNHGIPESIYHDRHTILLSPKAATIDDELAGREPQSQFQRVVSELGIVSIPAGSPQAKGRIEHTWGTLQDRLVKEMRLARISTMEQANLFLADFVCSYNKRFGQEAADPQTAWVKMEPQTDIAYYFSAKESRVVRADHTIAWLGQTLQILPSAREKSLAGTSIDVHVTPEGELFLYDGKRRLEYHKITSPPKQTADRKPAARTSKPRPENLAKRRAWLFAKPAA